MWNVPLGMASRWLVVALVCLVGQIGVAVEEEVALDIAPPTSPGTLVICGGGDVPDSVMLHFIELAGGTRARIVFIPTAAEGADREEQDEDLDFFRKQDIAGLSVVHTRSRDKANDPEFARPLANATGVWFGGGCQSLLTDAYLGTTAEELIRVVLDRGGVIGGISAGAAIMSPVMIRGGDLEPEVGQGFGFLPGTVIDQHFLKRNRQDRLMRVLSAHPGLVGIGIDEGTALIVRGHRLSVMGDSHVVTCLSASNNWPAQVERLKPGDEVDLVDLIRAAVARMRPRLEPDVESHPTELPSIAVQTPPAARPVGPALFWDARSHRFLPYEPPQRAQPPQLAQAAPTRAKAVGAGNPLGNSQSRYVARRPTFRAPQPTHTPANTTQRPRTTRTTP